MVRQDLDLLLPQQKRDLHRRPRRQLPEPPAGGAVPRSGTGGGDAPPHRRVAGGAAPLGRGALQGGSKSPEGAIYPHWLRHAQPQGHPPQRRGPHRPSADAPYVPVGIRGLQRQGVPRAAMPWDIDARHDRRGGLEGTDRADHPGRLAGEPGPAAGAGSAAPGSVPGRRH